MEDRLQYALSGQLLVPERADDLEATSEYSRPRDRFGDTTREMVSRPLGEAASRVRSAGRVEGIDPDANPVFNAARRAGDYVGDMAMAGLHAADAAFAGASGLVGETLGDMGGRGGEKGLARDVYAMPEAFLGFGMGRAANQIDALADSASSVASTAAARATQPGPVPDQLGVFAGKSALTTDDTALGEAQRRASVGEDPRQIWKDTGFYRAADGEWRWEIDDSPMKVAKRPKMFEQKPLGEVIEHEKLFEAYPELRDIRVYTDPELDEGQAYFDHRAKVIGIPDASVSNPDFDKDFILHEVQHYIQTKEGFASGGDPAEIRADLKMSVEEAFARGDFGQEEYDRRMTRINHSSDGILYNALLGEQESMNAEYRRRFGPEKRRLRFPEDTQTFPRDETIVFDAQSYTTRQMRDEEKTEAPLDSGRGSLPPAENAQRTQIAGTFPTYEKAAALLDENAPDGPTLDFGAGLGLSQERLGWDTYEPFPREGFNPTYNDTSSIPSNSYARVTNLNVLNVVPREIRDEIVTDIGRVLQPGGTAVITTRGRDVMGAKGTPGPEPMSMITSRDTYQKGFAQQELREYLQETLGDEFDVQSVKLGPAGAIVTKKGDTLPSRRDNGDATPDEETQ